MTKVLAKEENSEVIMSVNAQNGHKEKESN